MPAARVRPWAEPVMREWLSVASHLDPQYGGIAAMLPELSMALASDGRSRAALLGLCNDREADHILEAVRGSAFTMESSRWAWLLDAGWRERFTARLAKADLIHIHGLWEPHCVAAARAAQKLGTPYVISAHGMLERWAVANKRFKKAVYGRLIENRNIAGAACLHALTLAEAEDYRRFGATNPIAVVPNGVRVPTCGTAGVSADRFLERYPQLQDRRLVLYLGRIHYKKGLDLLVRSWKQVTSKTPDAHLVIAGPDFENTQESVARAVAESGVSDRVTFTGMLSGPEKWSALAACEFFVLPSYSEGLSMSVLEALAMAKPVVITRQCNVPEVAQRDCGWTIEPAVPALTGALLAALDAPADRLREMGANGKALVKQRFSWDSVGERMRGVYEWVLGGPRPADVVLVP